MIQIYREKNRALSLVFIWSDAMNDIKVMPIAAVTKLQTQVKDIRTQKQDKKKEDIIKFSEILKSAMGSS